MGSGVLNVWLVQGGDYDPRPGVLSMLVDHLISSVLELLLLEPTAPREHLLIHVEHAHRVGDDAEEVGRHAAVESLDSLFPEDELEALCEPVVFRSLARWYRLS